MKKRIFASFLAFLMVFGVMTVFVPQIAQAVPWFSQATAVSVVAGSTATGSVGINLPDGFLIMNVTAPDDQSTNVPSISRPVHNGGSVTFDVFAPSGIEGQFNLTITANWVNTNPLPPGATQAISGQIQTNIPITVTRGENAGDLASSISITSPTAPIQLAPGESRVVPVAIRNFSTTNITNINFLPRLFVGNPNVSVAIEDNLAPFSLSANASRTINLRLTAADNAPAGSQTGLIEFSYTINRGNVIEFSELEIPVNIAFTDDRRPNIVMESFVPVPSIVNSGQNFTFNVTLRNTSSVAANNVSLSWAIPGGSALQIRGTNSENIGTIPANSTRQVAINLTTATDTSSGSYPIALTLRHDHQQPTAGETINYHISVTGVDGATDRASLRITSLDAPSGQFLAGEEARFSVTVQNVGEGQANNIRIAATPDTGVVSRLASIQTLPSLASGESRTFEFAFAPTTEARGRFHNIGFAVSYNDGATTQTFEQFTGINVVNVDDGNVANIQITNIIAPTGQFVSGQQASVTVIISNMGEVAARNIRITANPDTGLVSRLASIQTLPSLEPGQSRAFEFAFAPTASAANRFHNIGFTVRYNDGQEEQTFEQYSGISVLSNNDEDGENRSVPRIIISDYTVDPLMVMANTEFDLYLTMQNTHQNRTVRNMRVTLEVVGTASAPGQTNPQPSAVFTPVNASNTFHIQEIAPRSTAQHHIRLFAIPDAAPMNHTIVVRFDYEDEDGNPFTATENIGVNVRQNTRVEIGDPGIGTFTQMGFPMQLSFNVHNSGRSTLFNLRVRFESEGFETSMADEMFGNVQPGHGGNFWNSITPIMPGMQTIYMITTWEDVMAEQHEEIRTFHVDVMGGWDGGDGWDGPDIGYPGDDIVWCPECGNPVFEGVCSWCGWTESSGIPLVLILSIAAGGVVVVVGGTVLTIVLVRKSRKNNPQYDDFDDDM